MSEPLGFLPPLREVIARHGLSAKKSLGQNFLLDLNLTRRIARTAGPLEGRTIVEIGPGPGGLTRALLMEGAARVIAVERDERCFPALDEIARASMGRLDIISGDALALDMAEVLRAKGVKGRVKVAANLPYNVGTALLVRWLTLADWPPWFESLTLMFQREVAKRIVAKPGTEAYGRLSVLAQWRAKARILFDVNPRAFTPAPKVTSSVVRIEPLEKPLAPCSLPVLEKVTAAAFGQRRKMLRSSLKSLTPEPEKLLAAAGIEPTKRAEEISVDGFAALARGFSD